MEFACYANWSELPESANRLFEQGAKQSVFLSCPWFENLEATPLEEGQSMLLACVVERDSVLAILPLIDCNDGHLKGLTNLYSSLHGLLVAEQNRQAILACLVRGLDTLKMLSLRIDPVAEDDRNIQRLQQVMEQTGYQTYRRFRFHNWFYPVKARSFEAYMAERPSRVRNTVNRKKRKLEREHACSIRLFTDDDLETGLDDYHAVYRASWKAFEQYEGFVQGLAYSLSKQGWLRLAVLYIDGKPAAAQFWFVVNGKASIFKLVYDEAWKQYSPGSILISYLMQHVIEKDKVEEIDFLTGNDAYKQDWMSERRQRWVVSFYRSPRPKRGIARMLSPLKNMLSK